MANVGTGRWRIAACNDAGGKRLRGGSNLQVAEEFGYAVMISKTMSQLKCPYTRLRVDTIPRVWERVKKKEREEIFA